MVKPTTWDEVKKRLEAIHNAYGTNLHRPAVVVVFYPKDDGTLSAGWLAEERYYPLDGSHGKAIMSILQRSEGPGSGVAEA